MSEELHEITQHATIGPIKGLRKGSGVVQYLGVQYATLKDRFARGELLESYSGSHPSKQGGSLNATRIGPVPVSPENGCEWEQTLLQHPLPFGEYPQSDTECLTLNIAVPSCNPRTRLRLPVLVFVHGGAFATGSSSYPQNDLARIVQLSSDINKPMIAVGVNYRLGAPGFLYSSAMEAAGYKPNNGLDDQRLALRWVQRHIPGFGGDPQKVTFMGESAGGASGCFHLHSAAPLFHQFISMSGTSLLQARSPEVLERSFARVTDIFGINDLTPQEQVQHLLKVPIDDLRARVGRQVPLGPMVDGDMIHETTTFQALAGRSDFERLFPGAGHCQRILVGDCQMDAAALAPRLESRTDILPQTLVNCLLRVLKPTDTDTATAVIAAYGLDDGSMATTQTSTERVLNVGNDVCFAVAAQAFARAWSLAGHEAFLYRFNCPNPWNGVWKGYATHILDLAFLLLNYNEYLSQGQRENAERFAKDVITFVHGGEPWMAYRSGIQEGSMVYDAPAEGDLDRSEYVGWETPQLTGRRDIMQSIDEPGLLDRMMEGWQLFMAQK